MNQDRLAGGIKTSGERRTFETGAHRDSNDKVLKGRMDLIPAVAMKRFAIHCNHFAAMYDMASSCCEAMADEVEHIEEMHISQFYGEAMSSMYAWMEGERIEEGWTFDHLGNVLWNTQQLMHLTDPTFGEVWFPKLPDDFALPEERWDMISPLFTRRVSIHYQLGGINYGDRNWEKGMPAMVTWDCATRHLTNWLEKEDTEDHLAAVGWNVMSTMHTVEMVKRGLLPESLIETIPMYKNIVKGKSKIN